MDLDEEIRRFLEEEFLTYSINGATQHCPIYNKEASEEHREALRKKLRSLLRDYGKEYASAREVSEAKHLKNICEICATLTKDFGCILNGGKFRIGVAQKALNLYLKYLWCAGRISIPPPHCPFDFKIISKLDIQKGAEKRWTKMDCIEHYREWVMCASKKAGQGQSLAEWELRTWNRDP